MKNLIVLLIFLVTTLAFAGREVKLAMPKRVIWFQANWLLLVVRTVLSCLLLTILFI